MTAMLIARNTFREATRDRLLAGVFGAGLALLALTQVAGPLAMGEARRLTLDLTLSGISALGLLIVLLVGTSLVAKEIERRTIHNLLSRPIARPAYLVGRWAGLTAALWTVALGLGVALWAVLAARGEPVSAVVLGQGVYFAALELAVVTALATLFSALSTPVLSSLYTLGFVLAGQWSYDLRAFAAHFPPGARQTVEVVASVMPNLPLFNVRTLVADGRLAEPLHVVLATGYAVLYAGCALALAAAAFESRDFK